MNTMQRSLRVRNSGHVLVTAVSILTVMAMVAGATIKAVSSRYKTAYRTAAWHESLVVAESGVDMTLAQVTGQLPDVQLNAQSGLNFATSTFSSNLATLLQLQSGGLTLKNGVAVTLTPDALTHAGEGGTTTAGSVTIEVLPLNQVLNGNLLSSALSALTSGTIPTINLIRITSSGTVFLPGSSREADVSKLDAELNHAVLVTGSDGKVVSQPYVSRQIQVLLKPVFPFQNGVVSNGYIHSLNAASNFDSFSSASPLTSTNGIYDPTKSRGNIQVSTNTADMQFAGKVFGNVYTNSGTLVKNSQITGSVNDNYFAAVPAVSAPTWSGSAAALSGSVAVSGGSVLAPTQTMYSSVSGTLHVKAGTVTSLVGGLLGGLPVVSTIVNGEADIYVKGNFNGTLIVDSGVTVHLYIQGNANFGPNGIQNLSNVASNVEIYGVPSTSGGTPAITIDTTGSPVAAVYAPLHSVVLSGNGAFSGALTVSSLDITGSADVHYDEALALQVSPVLGYEMVSWKELNVP